MDPISIVGLIATVASIGDVLTKSISKLSDLRSRYHDAPVQITTLIGQLFIIRAAISELGLYRSSILDQNPRFRHLALQLDTSLDCLCPLIQSLQQYLDDVEVSAAGDPSSKGKVSYIWNEREMGVYLGLVDRQVNALNLFLQAVQCSTWAEQQRKVEQDDSQTVLRLARDCSSSILGLTDGLSVFSEDTNAVSLTFDFDAIVLSSKVYQSAHRSHLKQAIRAGKRHSEDGNTTYVASEQMGQEERVPNAPLPPISELDGHSSSPEVVVFQPEAGNSQLNATEHEPFTPTDAGRGIMVRKDVDVTHESLRRPSDASTQPSSPPPTQSEDSRASSDAAQSSQTSLYPPLQTSDAPSDRSKPGRDGAVPPRFPGLAALRSLRSAIRQRRGDWTTAKVQSDAIDKYLVQSAAEQSAERKILILGSGEGGKSALLQNIKIHLEGGYTVEERSGFAEIIFSNVTQSTRVVLEAMESLEVPLANQELEADVQTIFSQPVQLDTMPLDVAHAIRRLWADPGFHEAWQRRHEYQLSEMAKFFADNIERLADKRYVPTNQDAIYARWKTTGITETTYVAGNDTLRIYDVGGVRSERKKWIHVFEKVTTIVFVADMTAWNRLLFEDETVNRMQEQFTLFDSLTNSRWFKNTAFVLLFTKMDQLDTVLEQHEPTTYFPEFNKAGTFELAENFRQRFLAYIENRFRCLIHDEEKRRALEVVYADLVGTDAKGFMVDLMPLLTRGPDQMN